MGLFNGKNKDGNITCTLTYIDGIENFPQNMLVDIEQNDDERCVYIKQAFSKKPPVRLGYSQITDLVFFSEKEIIEKDKSVVGRAIVGGLLLGPVGSLVGGMSGTGKKEKTQIMGYFIFNYRPTGSDEVKALSFSVKNSSFNVHSAMKALKEKLNIPEKTYAQSL